MFFDFKGYVVFIFFVSYNNGRGMLIWGYVNKINY